MEPCLSILVPFFNDEPWLDEALASIAAQTRGDFEVVMSDDRGSDRSSEIAAAWADRDSRFRLVRNPSNLGMTANWNSALRSSRGRYVAKLDADDRLEPRFAELLLPELENDSEVSHVFCRTLDCDADGVPVGSYLGERGFLRAGIEPLERRRERGTFWYRHCFDGYQLWHSNAQLHRRERLLAMGGWNADYGCVADTDLILRVLEQDEPVIHHPYVGVHYRRRGESVSSRFEINAWKAAEGCLAALSSLERARRAGRPMSNKVAQSWRRLAGEWKGHRERLAGEAGGLPRGLAAAVDDAETPAGIPAEIVARALLQAAMDRVGRLYGKALSLSEGRGAASA